MSYLKWFKSHSKKHKLIMKKLNFLSNCEVINYFEYSNLSKLEQNFCQLFKLNQKCHNLENLNCYFCGCPNFRFNDNSNFYKNGKKVFSYCSINSKDGLTFETDFAIHQDCSNCTIPHSKEYVSLNFDRNWLKCMDKTTNF